PGSWRSAGRRDPSRAFDRTIDPSQPDDASELPEHLAEIEACHSIAGDASCMLFVRVATPRALETLIRDIRLAASVRTRTTIVLQTFFENRPVSLDA
ncbi:MAG: Lrp/AsnC ligand binding domain-containing protein, partial [Microbacterium sp.]